MEGVTLTDITQHSSTSVESLIGIENIWMNTILLSSFNVV